jgi:hypothetical protein
MSGALGSSAIAQSERPMSGVIPAIAAEVLKNKRRERSSEFIVMGSPRWLMGRGWPQDGH